MPIRDEAINVFMGLPGDGDRLELTYNHGVDSYELGTGYNHIALTVDDLDGTLGELAEQGHRAREAAVPGARGRLPDLLRARPGRLPHRAHRARLTACPQAAAARQRAGHARGRAGRDGSPSSTSGRTRSGWSSSARRADGRPRVVAAHRRDPRGGAHRRRARRRRASSADEPMERALETLELFAHFCRATGDRGRAAGRDLGDPRRDQPGRVPARRARAHGPRGARALARGGGPLRLPGRGQLDDAGRRRRARPRRRLDAAHPRRRAGSRPTRAPGRSARCA